ncbi:Transient receptor potential cation channel subfamily V member 5 [Acropora cervicornis]|uniref:Transient receptor potential cation channel subfamily V member 5 n=1 Tax=Acropora cervicornis TaxID=6130 RepID=A0AAD9Q8N3_ACRCE|nr:Transient receptor potential cation channel subfamily V member 5 [Acropora cervicornis]
MAETGVDYTMIQMFETKRGREDLDFEESFDEEFWLKFSSFHLKVEGKVNSCLGMSWNRAMDEVRIERLMAKYGRDILLIIIRDWPACEKYKDKPELVASLEYLISRFTEIVLDRDSNKEYRFYYDEEDPACPTLLHLAVGWNFLHVAKLLVERYPSLVYTETQQVEEEREYLPVEKALMLYNDETAAYLISQMKPDRNLVSFLKKTVLAVLDRLVSPHWPYMPEKFEELHLGQTCGSASSSVPDDPLNYYFWYHLLEADENGIQPVIDEHKNKMFNAKSTSCLQHIAESGDKEAIQHPVVRLLVTRKWKLFGHWWFCLQASLYVVFLLLLSYALICGSTQDDPMQYRDTANVVRLICEILSIIFLVFYLFKEIDQAVREWRKLFKDLYNYFDFLGLVLTILVIPLRFVKVNSQWSVAGLGYFFSFLKLFKFSCLSRTLAKVVYRDMSRFSVVFVIVFLGFCGALFMALKALDKQDMYLDYSLLMLAAVRALVEQQPVEEDYSKFSWLAILIILAYMAMVIVILLNVLIAQLSFTYSEAKSNAKLQYAIDRIVIVTRIEYSRFARFNLRVKCYLEGEDVGEGTLAKEILEYDDERNQAETVEEKLTLIRDLMRKVLRKVLHSR